MGILTGLLVLVVSFTNMVASQVIVGENRRKIIHTDGKVLYIIGIIAMAIIGFGSLKFIDILDPNVMKWFWLGFLILTLGFHFLLEWKFLKETKIHSLSNCSCSWNYFYFVLIVQLKSMNYIKKMLRYSF